MHSHISSVIYASITQKEMYLVSHVLNCINWKRGLTLCRGTGTPLPQPQLQMSPALGGSGTLRVWPPRCCPLSPCPGASLCRVAWCQLPPSTCAATIKSCRIIVIIPPRWNRGEFWKNTIKVMIAAVVTELCREGSVQRGSEPWASVRHP